MSILKKYLSYSNERFPIVGAMLYAASLFFVSYTFCGIFKGTSAFNIVEVVIGVLITFLVMLNLRVFDEHKDYEDDKIAHPERMLSRGEITLADLRKLLLVVVVIEAGLSFYIGTSVFIMWIAVMIWSLLMFFEFFVSEFLNKRIGLYLVSHQLLLPVIVIFAFSFRYNLMKINSNDIYQMLLFSLGIMFATMTYEISRKTWSKGQEHENADSYTSEWGIVKTVIVSQFIALSGTAIMIYFYFTYKAGMVYTIVMLAVYIIYLLIEIMFMKNPTEKNSKLVESVGVLYLIALFINTGVFFY